MLLMHPSRSDHFPMDREQIVGRCLLAHTAVQSVDQSIPLLGDLVFDAEDFLPLPPLLLFQVSKLLLKIILLIEGGCQPGLTGMALIWPSYRPSPSRRRSHVLGHSPNDHVPR